MSTNYISASRHMMKRTLGVCTTALLAVGLTVTGMSAASADDLAPVEGVEVAQVAEVVEVAEPVVEKVAVTAELTPAPAEVVQARAPRPDPVVQEPTPATPADTGETITVFWQLPKGTDGSSPFATIWPQTYLGTSADALACGFTAQWDTYRYGTDADRAAVDALWADGVLSAGPEDAGLHPVNDSSSWGFVTAPDCEIPVVIPNMIETSHTATCGAATVSLRNVSPWIYPVTYTVDGGAEKFGPVVDNRTGGKLSGPQKDVTGTKSFTFAEDSGTHTIRYRVAAGTEKDLYKGLAVGEWAEFTVESDCVPNVPVKPAPVAVVTVTEGEFTCDDTEVDVFTKTTNVGHVLVDNVWVLNPLPSDRSKTVTTTRALTEAEIASLECVVVPPVVDVPKVETPVAPAADALPRTGGNDLTPIAWFAGLMTLAGAGLMIRKSVKS